MVINISVQYSGGLLLDIILFTQGHYQWGTRLNTMSCSGFVFIPFVMYITTTVPCVMVYYTLSLVCF